MNSNNAIDYLLNSFAVFGITVLFVNKNTRAIEISSKRVLYSLSVGICSISLFLASFYFAYYQYWDWNDRDVVVTLYLIDSFLSSTTTIMSVTMLLSKNKHQLDYFTAVAQIDSRLNRYFNVSINYKRVTILTWIQMFVLFVYQFGGAFPIALWKYSNYANINIIFWFIYTFKNFLFYITFAYVILIINNLWTRFSVLNWLIQSYHTRKYNSVPKHIIVDVKYLHFDHDPFALRKIQEIHSNLMDLIESINLTFGTIIFMMVGYEIFITAIHLYEILQLRDYSLIPLNLCLLIPGSLKVVIISVIADCTIKEVWKFLFIGFYRIEKYFNNFQISGSILTKIS